MIRPRIALLKVIAYLDDPYRRAKDILDLKALFNKYDAHSDRIFSDELFDAKLQDSNQASAYLLGLDLGLIATDSDRKLLQEFLERQLDRDTHTERFRLHLEVFQQGIG